MRKLLALVSIVVHSIAFAQSGPGGVGSSASVTDSLMFWLRADSMVSTNGSSQLTWTDISGNDHVFTSDGTEISTTASAINGRPAIDFNTVGAERLLGPNTASFFGESSSLPTRIGDVFAVFLQEGAGEQGYISQFPLGNNNSSFITLWGNATNDADVALRYRNTGTLTNLTSSGGSQSDNFTLSQFHAARWGFDPVIDSVWLFYGDELAGSATGLNLSYNGDQGDGPVRIGGAGADDAEWEYKGQIAEYFVYGDKLSDAAMIVVMNYFNARYGSAISITNDFYVGTGGFTEDVIGIGNEGSSEHMASTGAGGGLYLSGTSGAGATLFDSDEWLFAGHDGATTTNTYADIPAGDAGKTRITRVWKLEKTEGVTNPGMDVVLTFDLGELGVGSAAGLTLYKRTATNGDFTNLMLTPSPSGDQVSFTVPDANTDDAEQYFTLAYDANIPGGVSTNLALWLKANAGVETTGNAVDDWRDQTASANDATDPSGLSELQANVTNFNPGVAFNNDATSLEGTVVTTNSNFTFFTAYQDNSSASSGRALFEFNSGPQSHSLTDDTYAGGGSFTSNITKNSPALITVDHPSGTSANLFQDGASFESGYTTIGTSASGTYSYTLGDDDNGGNEFQGTINEIIAYEGTLGPTDREQVESYLAIKYGITLAHDYRRSDGTLIFDVNNSTLNDGYENQIVGLGNDATSGLNQKVSKSRNDSLILALENDFTSSNDSRSGSLNDDSFFFASNDGGNFETTSSAGNVLLNRVWKINESGTVGSVFLGIPTSLYEFDSLLVSTDPTFNTGVTRTVVTTSGGYNSVSFDFTSGQYFTFSVAQSLSADNADLLLWLRADAGVSTSGSNVTTWADQSINGNDADNDDSEFDNEAQLNAQTEDPVELANNSFNFNPSITFGNDDRPLTGSMTTTGGFNFFLVGLDSEAGSNTNAWFDTFQDNSPGANNNRNYLFEERYANTTNFTTPTANGSKVIYSILHPEGNTADLFENGAVFEAGYTTAATNDNDAALYHYVIGDDATGGNEFTGQIAEFIAIQGTIDAAQRQRIESYLAIKYAISLNSDYVDESDNIIFDVTNSALNDRFENYVAALGRNDVYSLDQKVARSDSGNLVIATEQNFEDVNSSRATSLSDRQYFFVSANTGSVASDSSYRSFTGNRLGRKWKVSETNSPGSVYVAISDTVAANFNVLIISTDSTFTSNVNEIPISQSGGFYFVNHDFSSGEYFTFANSVSPGGVGSGLQLWLSADAGVTETGGNVSAWADRSGNANDGTTPATDPVIVTNAINYNPAIEFATIGTRVQGSLTTTTDSLSVLIVATDSSASASNRVLFELDDSVTPLAFDDGAYATVNFASEILKDTAQLLTVVQSDAASSTNIYQNGAAFETNINPSAASAASYSYSIGENVGGGNAFDGLVAEFLVYDSALTDTDREMLESYLAVKYALPVTHDITASDGSTVMDATASAGYLNGLVGLGYDVRTQLDQKVGKSVYDSIYLATTNDFATANTSRTTAFDDLQYVLVTNDGGNYTITSDYKAESNVRLDRVWEVHELNNPGAIYLALPNSGVFTSLNTILLSSDPTFATGVTERSLTVSGAFLIANIDLTDGQYFTFTTAAPESSIWYSYLSGNWSDPANWTLDGAISPLYLNPSSEIPSEGDSVVINSGRTITSDLNSLLVERVEINGTLDLASTGSHDFTYLLGNGILRLSGNSSTDNYPSGIDTLFYDSNEGGTVEYYGSGLTLDTKRRYNDLRINMNTSNDEVVHTGDSLWVFGDMTITQGTFQFGDNSTPDDEVMAVTGNVLIEANGGIEVGNTNSRHEFNLSGNFTNQGTVAFTNRTLADFFNEATDGIVDVNFISATQDQTVDLQNSTAFYRFEVNKGVDDTYKVSIAADDPSYFALYGFADQGHASTAQLTSNDNNIGLIYGTLELGNNIQVNELTESGNFNVSEGAALTVNGGSLTASRWVVNYGSVSVLAGSMDLGIGTVTRNSGQWIVEGGTLDMGHFRTSALGFGNDGSWTQTGGIVNITGSGSQGSYYSFSLTYTTCSFTMTGGQLNIASNNSNTSGIFLNSAPENTTVTGGTVTIDMAHTDTDSLFITSSVPFYNLVVSQSVANANPEALIIVDGGNSGGTAPDGVTLGRNTLEILNDFTIDNSGGNGTTLVSDHNPVDVTGSLTIQSGATFNVDSTAVTFEGAGSSQIRIQTGSTFVLDTLIINKDIADIRVDLEQGNQTALQVDSLFSFQSGIFDIDTLDVHIGKNVVVNDTIGSTSSIGTFVLNGASAQTVDSDGSGYIYDMVINNANGVSLTGGDLYVDTLNLNNGVFDINTNKLTSNSEIQTSGTFSSTTMIQTDGNASDGGLEYYFDGGTANPTAITYPIGTDANAVVRYTPVEADLSAISDDGFVQIRTSDTELQTVDLTALANNLLTYYWRVSHSGFGTTPTVDSYVFTSVDNDDPDGGATPAGLPVNFVPGKVLDELPFTRSQETTPDISNFDITFNDGFNLENANYTAGDGTTNLFVGTPQIYYTADRATQFPGRNWNASGTWSTVGHYSTTNAGTFPQDGDVVFIGFSPQTTDETQRSHWILMNVDVNVAQITFRGDSVQNAASAWITRNQSFTPQLVIDENRGAIDLGVISGEGTFNVEVDCSVCNADPTISVTQTATITADFGDFASVDDSRFDYDFEFGDNVSIILPTSFPNEYPNLHIKGGSGSERRLIIPEDILVRRDLIIRQNAILQLSDGAAGDIEVMDDINFTVNDGNDEIEFPTSGNARTLTVHDDIQMEDGDNDVIEVLNTSPNGLTHRLRIGGSIDQQSGNTIDLFNGNAGDNNAVLELFGTTDGTYTTDDNILDLYRLEVNKGSDTTSTFTFSNNFNLNGPNTASPQSLELQNGKLILNNAAINIQLADNSDFDIPLTAGLEVTQGAVTSTGANIILDGLLRINGGTATLATTDIEYTSTGTSLIEVTSGTLNVGGQVRRSLTSSNGVLKYRQTGGDVDIATDGAGSNTRGAFEVLNSGSEFTLTGGTFNIERGVTGDTNTSLELSPTTFDLTGSTITIYENLGANYGANFFNVASSIALNNLTIANTIDLPDVQLFNQNLEVNDLTINTNQALLSNGFNLTLNGDFSNSGTYTNTSTETIFAGSGAQSIGGAGTYTIYDLRKSGSGTTTSSITLDVDHDLILTAGTLDIGSNSINLENDAFIQSTLTNSGGNGLVFDGNTNQELSGRTNDVVDIGTITISNASGVDIPDGNGYDFNITQELRLNGGVFNIGGSLVTLVPGAPVTAVSPFSVGNMVQTNSSFTDNGLKIDFFTVAADTSVFFPIGELKYTPVQFDLNAGTTAGGIRVRPANERHPTIIDDAEPGTMADPEIDDTQNVLQYHWIVVAETLTNANGTASFFYDHSDITNTQTDTIDFISARLLSNGVNWDKFPPTLFFGQQQRFDIPISVATDAQITGDYTAGAGSSDGINADIEGAIPDQLAQYETNLAGAGNYSAAASWTTLNGPDVTDGVGPVGAQIIVRNGDDLTLNLSNIRLYSTEIESGGILRIPTGITGVRLGNVSGSGTIVLEDNELLPTGEYTSFLTCSGGALQYSGSTTYSVLSGISQIRKLVFEGTGTRTLPNNALSVCDTLEINGPTIAFNSGQTYSIGDTDTDRLDIQAGAVTLTNSSTIDVTGDFLVSGGSFTGSPGTSMQVSDDINFSGGTFDWNSTSVTLDGTTEQLVDGAFTGSSSFDDLVINNSDATGVTINSGDVVIDGTLTLTDGLVNSTTTETITLTSTGDWTGASSASYITGPITKNDVAVSSTYEFPVGKSARYAPVSIANVGTGADNWTAEYFTSMGAYPNGTFDNTDPGSGFNALQSVEGSDRWQVESAGSNTAQITATYGSHNGFIGTDVRVVWWDDEAVLDGDGADNRWENQGGIVVGTAASGTVTSENSIFFSVRQIALGYAPPSVLPVELLELEGRAEDNIVHLSWSTATELNNDYFEILHSLDGIEFESKGRVVGNGTTNELQEYAFIDRSPAPGLNYYRLKQVDFDGAFEYSKVIKIENDFIRKGIESKIYPNPTTPDNLNLSVSSGDNHTPMIVRIVNLSGQVFYTKQFEGEVNFDDKIIPARTMKSGLYFLIVKQGDNISRKKIVIR